MNFKKVISCACAATVIAGAVGFSGCGLFGKKTEPMTVTQKGFSVELDTSFTKLSIDTDNDDILYDNTIIAYSNDDMNFYVSQIPRDDIIDCHVFDLGEFAAFVVQDYYGEDPKSVSEFKSSDGKIDGYTFNMSFTSSGGYANVQTDYLFAGTDNFYEVSAVCFAEDYSKLKSTMDEIALTCSATDGLNVTDEIELVPVTIGNMTTYLDESYFAFTDSDGLNAFTNGVVVMYPYFVNDVKYLTLGGLENDYMVQAQDSTLEFTHVKTYGDKAEFSYCVKEIDKIFVITALYIDDEGNGYMYEYFIPDYGYTDMFVADVANFMYSATGAIEDYDENELSAVAKTFKGEAPAPYTYKYSLTLDDTYLDLGWDEDYENFMLWNAELNRTITITKATETTVTAAYDSWLDSAPQYCGRQGAVFGTTKTGLTYENDGQGRKFNYAVTIFLDSDNGIFIVTLSTQFGYFKTSPTDSSSPDYAILQALTQITFE